MYGCPEAEWNHDYLNLTIPYDTYNTTDIYWEIGKHHLPPNHTVHKDWNHLHILGPYSDKTFQFNFCIRDDMESTIGDQLRGNFCTFKVGHQCPEGLSNVHFVIVRSIFLFFVLPCELFSVVFLSHVSWYICVTNDHGCVPLVTRVTRRVSLVEHPRILVGCVVLDL